MTSGPSTKTLKVLSVKKLCRARLLKMSDRARSRNRCTDLF